jgi:hypothetical protein
MEGVSNREERDDFAPNTDGLPGFRQDWDRDLGLYNITELPVLPADGDPGSEKFPFGLRILRELCLDAANSHSPELWFDFAPNRADGKDLIDACWSSTSEGTQCVRMPKSVLLEGDDELGVFGNLLRDLADDGMFAIHVSEFRDSVVSMHNLWDKHGRLMSPQERISPGKPDVPGVLETVTIRAFRVALKGNSIPNDIVIQVCPRFWHMPTGFEVG